MNNKIMKILSASLAFLMLICAFPGCSEQTADNEAPATETATDTTAAESTRLEAELPEVRYDGYKFRILSKGATNIHWNSKDVAVDELTGEVINDAVYQRNLNILDKYGVTIVEIPSPGGTWDLKTTISSSVQAGSDDFDMATPAIAGEVPTLSMSNMLIDLNSLDYVDLEKPWYDQNANSQLSIGDKLYVTSGDMIIMDNEATVAVLFNKQMVDDYGFEDLYTVVEEGRWTSDYMLSLATEVTKDLDGDSIQGAKDQWGVIGEPPNTYFYMVAFGAKAFTKNDDNLPEVTMKVEKFYDAFLKAASINKDFSICMFETEFSGTFSDVYGECIDPAFAEGRVLFNVAGLVRVTYFREMETDFGIIPLPKFNEEQESYLSPVSLYCSNSIVVPSSVTDLDRTGIIIEDMSCESHYLLTPAYYNTTLKTKASRDEKSGEMLDLIFANTVFDLGFMYNWGGSISRIYALGKDGNVSSLVESMYASIEKSVQDTIDTYASLD